MKSQERIWILISRAVSGEITPAEQREMELIFATEPKYHTDYQNLVNLKLTTSAISKADERRAMERGLQKFNESLDQNGFTEKKSPFVGPLEPLPVKRLKKIMLAAAVIPLFILSFLGYKYLHRAKDDTRQVVKAANGKRIQQILPDGSAVWINSGSSVTYTGYAENGKREVILNGEAYFDVKHDSKHPFIVHAGKLNVVVLGTAFDVKAYAADAFIETTLLRGKVVILDEAKPGSSTVLLPNQKIRVYKDEAVSKKSTLAIKQPVQDSASVYTAKGDIKAIAPDESIEETAWVSNKLSFKKENFDELALQLSRWYGVTIAFDDDNFSKKQFTGTFKNQDINEVMHALQLTQPFHYSITNNQIHIW